MDEIAIHIFARSTYHCGWQILEEEAKGGILNGGLSTDAACATLNFCLSPDAATHVNDLAAKARAGTLAAEERTELDDYERITALLEIMQSKTRVSLKQAAPLCA
jgi:hypothetical protein